MVSLLKKLALILLIAAPCRAQLLDLTKHAQGGGSVDSFLQGGTVTPTYGTLTSGCVAITYTSPNFACVPAADATHNGYLTYGDWSTFNGKQPAGSYALQSTTLTASSPLTGGGDLSTNRSFGCQLASASQAGCLSSTDWSTFNGKQAALSSTTPVTHQFLTGFTAPNTFAQAQPGFGDLSGIVSLPSQCPTCSTGPNLSTVGGIIGAEVVSVGSGITYCWFCYQTAQTFSNLPTDIWIGALTANIRGSMSVGSYYSVGYVSYQGATGYPGNQQFTINSAATAGAYQSPFPFYQFLNNSAKSSINITSVSPTGGTAATMNYITSEVIGQNIQPLRWGGSGSTIAGSATAYTAPGQTTTANATESLMVEAFPYAATVANLCFSTTGAQPSGGALTATFRYGATFGAIASTSLIGTVPASGGAGLYCDFIHSVSVAAGGVMTFQIANASGSTGAAMNGISITVTPSGAGPTAMIVFPLGAGSIPSGSATYFPAFVNNTDSTTEANATAGMPRAGTAKNLYCYVTTAPGTNSDVVTVRQNLAAPASGLTVTITTGTTGIISDTSHTISLSNLDLIDLQHSQSSGTNPAVSSCSVEID